MREDETTEADLRAALLTLEARLAERPPVTFDWRKSHAFAEHRRLLVEDRRRVLELLAKRGVAA